MTNEINFSPSNSFSNNTIFFVCVGEEDGEGKGESEEGRVRLRREGKKSGGKIR